MKKENIEISIADFAAILLKAFKPLLYGVLILALLGGVFGLWRSISVSKQMSAFEDQLSLAKEKVLDSQNVLAESERALLMREESEIPQAEELVSRAEEQLANRKEYLEDSLYFSIDPFHCGAARLTVKLDQNNDTALAAFSSLSAFLSRSFSDNSELLPVIRNLLNTDAEGAYIRELISVSGLSDSIAEISVYHSDPQLADATAEVLFGQLNEYLNTSGASLRIIDHFCGYEVNLEMRDRQLSAMDDLILAEDALVDSGESLHRLKNEIPVLQKAVETASETLEKDTSELKKAQRNYNFSRLSAKNILLRVLTYMIVTACIGFLIFSFLIIVKCVSSGKLLNRNMILSGCEYPLIGELPSEKKRVFDRLIRRLEGEKISDYQSAANAVAQTLKALSDARSVCFVSSLGKSAAEELVTLTEGRIKACGDIVSDFEAISALSSYDGIVLVEEKDRSLIADLDSEIRRSGALGKDILGIILI